jgi:tartrate-resistant acid phosphatase type 5
MDDGARLTRRRFLASSFAFSAAATLAGCGPTIFEVLEQDPVAGGVSHLLMVGDWGTAVNFTDQAAVASAMQSYVANRGFSPDALFMLGDNFYGQMPGGVSSPRWQTQFEDLYPKSVYPGPAYAVPGNHDYQNAPTSKYVGQLAYAQLGTSRWTMPSRYYRFTYPAVNPTVTFIALDSNMPNEPAQPFPAPDASYYTQSDADRQVQLAWLTATLQEPLTTPFLVIVGHHPLYSNGPHGDNQTLIRDWDPLLRSSGAHLYLAGHDHDLQHLEFAGHPTSFVLSGGGGAALDTLNPAEAARGPFAEEVHGFTHLQVRPDLMIVRHLDTNGSLLHKFTKTPAGVVTILK